MQKSLMNFYMEAIRNRHDYSDPGNHKIIPAELNNIREALILAFSVNPVWTTIRAAIKYTDWTRYLGRPTDEIMVLAMGSQLMTNDLLGD